MGTSVWLIKKTGIVDSISAVNSSSPTSHRLYLLDHAHIYVSDELEVLHKVSKRYHTQYNTFIVDVSSTGNLNDLSSTLCIVFL